MNISLVLKSVKIPNRWEYFKSILYKLQEKVQAEIDSVVGKSGAKAGRTVGLDDRISMPYTDATLHEVLRHSCLVYVIPHSTTEDVQLSSYNLPRYSS